MNLRVKASYRPPAGRTAGVWPVQFTAGMNAQGQTIWVLQVYYRRLLIALAIMAVAGWLLAATALFFWLNQIPRNQVGWLDLAAPWRWSELRVKRGDTAVLTALDELKVRDYPGAFYNLRAGLSRSPGNVEGRLTLARLQAGYDPARSVTLMEDGIPLSAGDPKFINGLFAIYGSLQIQTHALEVADRLLREKGDSLPPEARFAVQRARVTVLLQLARYPEAEAALAGIGAPATPADRAGLAGMRIELLLRSGRATEARQFAEANPPADPADPGRLRQSAEIAIALGDADALQSALRRLKAQAPENPGVYLFAFQAWHRLKRLSYRDVTEQEYLQTFGSNDGALQALAALGVNLELPEVIARAQRVAAANRLSQFAYRVHQTELALRRGEIEAATRLLRDWENTIDTLKNPQQFYPEFIKRLARAAFAGTPDQVDFLLAHLAAGRGQQLLPVYQLAATVLEKSGNPAGADQALRAGLQLYPLSDPLLTSQQRIAALLPATANATAAAVSDAPAPAFILLPGNATEARDRIDELLQKDSLTEARNLLRAIRAQKPAWLPAAEAEISLREVELASLTLDQIATRTAARAYLDRYRTDDDGLRLVALVSRLIARERGTDARLLADEIAAASTSSVRVRLALQALNLADDLAAVAADQTAALGALDRWILAQEWAQAERLLKYFRDKPPTWLAAGATDLKVREVQVRLALDQRPLALAALKELIIKGGVSRSAAFKLVRDQLARGERDNAGVIAREILRLLPDDPAATRLVKEAEAPRPAE